MRQRVYVPPTAFAQIYIGLGRPADAIDWLEKGYDGRDPDMVLLRMPSFDPLRSQPRFLRLLKRMNFPD